MTKRAEMFAATLDTRESRTLEALSGVPIIALCDNEGAEDSHSVVVVGHGWNDRAET